MDTRAGGEPTRFGLSRRDWVTLGLSSIGGALEFFDFTVFIYFASIIGDLFFPSNQPGWLKEMQALAVFALGWFARPVGGIVIAHYGDRIGRKRLFMLTILLMGLPTVVIGLLPTYASIGIMAPILLLLMRMVQGLAIAGEVPGAVVFVSEHVGRHRVAFACAVIFALLYVGLFLGSSSAALLTRVLSHDDLYAWGWRIPFILGGLVALFTVYLRRHLHETPLFEQIRAQRLLSSSLPAATVVSRYLSSAIFVFVLSGLTASIATGIFQSLQNPLQTVYKFPRDVVLSANAVSILVLALTGPLWGLLADRIGIVRAFVIGLLATLAADVWFFLHIEQLPSDGSGLMLAWIALAIPGAFVCLIPSLAVLSFPTPVRYTGFAMPWNIGAAFLAGLIPPFVSLLSQFVGRASTGYLVATGLIVGLIASRAIPRLLDRAQRDDAVLTQGR